MRLIAHRGNINGPEPELENTPLHIMNALEKGYDVEIDVWYINDKWYLGHDKPTYMVERFLEHPNLWCHAKNLQALESMLDYNLHCFWHQKDDYTLTSNGYIWTYPNKPICAKSVIVVKDRQETQYWAGVDSLRDSNVYGVCSDYVGLLK